MALKGLLFLSLVLSVSAENTRLKEVFSWKTVEFVFPKDSDRADAIESGAFVPENNLPLGLDVWKDKLFITVPRWKSGVVSSLNYVDISGVEIPSSEEELEEEPTPIIEIEPSEEDELTQEEDEEEQPPEEEDEDEDEDEEVDEESDEPLEEEEDVEPPPEEEEESEEPPEELEEPSEEAEEDGDGPLDAVGGLLTGDDGDGGVLGGVGDLVTGGEDGDGPLDAVGGLLTGDDGDGGVLGGVGDLLGGGDGDGPLDAVGGLLTGDDGDGGVLGGVGDLLGGGDGDGPLDAVGGLLTGDDGDGGVLGGVGDLLGGGDGDGPLDAVGGLLTGDDGDGGVLGGVGDLLGGGDGDGPLDAVGGLLTGDDGDGGVLGGVGDLVTGGEDGDGPLDAVGGLLTGDDGDGGVLGGVGDLVTGGEDGDGPLDAVGGLLTGDSEEDDGLLGGVGDLVTGGSDEDGPLDAVADLLPDGDDEDEATGESADENEATEEGDDEDEATEGDDEDETAEDDDTEEESSSEEPSTSEEDESPEKRINSRKRNSLGEKKYQRVKRSITSCSGEGCEINIIDSFSRKLKTNAKTVKKPKKEKTSGRVTDPEPVKKPKKLKKKKTTANMTDNVGKEEKGTSKKTSSGKEQIATNNKKKDAPKKEKSSVKKPLNSKTSSKKKTEMEKACRDTLGNPCGTPIPDPVYGKPGLKPPKKQDKKKKTKKSKKKKASCKKGKKGCSKKACVKPAKVTATSPALIPYPDLETNTPTKDATVTKITSVFRIRVDACDRLWIMDTGIADILGNTVEYSKPQILIYDLNTDKLVKKYVFKPEDVQEHSFFANIIVDSDKSKCGEAFAYVPDLGSYAIVVYDLKKDKAWRIKHHYFHFNPLEGNYNVGGENFQWTDGVFGIALTKPNPDGSRTAYFHALSSYSEFMVNTLILQNEMEGKESNYTAYQLVGNKGPDSQTSASFIHEPTGIMFYTQVNKDAIYCWNTNKPFIKENLEEVASDSKTMVFPNDLKVDYNNNLWVLTDKLPVFVNKGLSAKEVNYHIFVSPVAEAIKDTNCAP